MVKCIKQILDMSRLVLNNPVNSRQTKLDKFKLAFSSFPYFILFYPFILVFILFSIPFFILFPHSETCSLTKMTRKAFFYLKSNMAAGEMIRRASML